MSTLCSGKEKTTTSAAVSGVARLILILDFKNNLIQSDSESVLGLRLFRLRHQTMVLQTKKDIQITIAIAIVMTVIIIIQIIIIIATYRYFALKQG